MLRIIHLLKDLSRTDYEVQVRTMKSDFWIDLSWKLFSQRYLFRTSWWRLICAASVLDELSDGGETSLPLMAANGLPMGQITPDLAVYSTPTEVHLSRTITWSYHPIHNADCILVHCLFVVCFPAFIYIYIYMSSQSPKCLHLCKPAENCMSHQSSKNGRSSRHNLPGFSPAHIMAQKPCSDTPWLAVDWCCSRIAMWHYKSFSRKISWPWITLQWRYFPLAQWPLQNAMPCGYARNCNTLFQWLYLIILEEAVIEGM